MNSYEESIIFSNNAPLHGYHKLSEGRYWRNSYREPCWRLVCFQASVGGEAITGSFHLLTYNTSSNNPNEIFVDDQGNFWDFKVKAAAELNGLTFSAIDAQNLSYDCKVSVTNAKIVKNGGFQNNGSPADLISMDVTFSDDEDGLVYHLEGVRYSGLEEND